MDDNQWEPDEEFFVKLTLIPGEDSENVKLGKTCIMEITILNDDGTLHIHFHWSLYDRNIPIYLNIEIFFWFNLTYNVFLEPGTLQFEKRGYLVKESCGNAELGVLRQNGADGIISVKWRTIDKSAINGKDYTGGEGEVKFKHGEVRHMLRISFFSL